MVYSGMPVCDLRHIDSVEAARSIEKIEGVAMVLFPEHADADVKAALAAVPMEGVASVIYVPAGAKVNIINGVSEIDGSSFSGEAEDICIINGVGIIRQIPENARGRIYVNGVLILHESLRDACRFSFPMINGMVKYIDFENYKIFGFRGDLDADTLQYLGRKTLFMAGYELYIDSDITPEMLQEKEIILMAGYQITCCRNVAGYIRATAVVGNAIHVLDE